jgi:hypothetical protein
LVVEHRVVPAAVVVVAWPAVVEVVVGAAVVGVVGVVVVTVVEVELPDEHAARTRPPRHTPPIRLITRFFISFSLFSSSRSLLPIGDNQPAGGTA